MKHQVILTDKQISHIYTALKFYVEQHKNSFLIQREIDLLNEYESLCIKFSEL